MKTSNHRPTKAIVDLAAIQFNIKQIAAHIPDNVEKWAVVKADAYGHGAVAVTQSIEPIVDGNCTVTIGIGLDNSPFFYIVWNMRCNLFNIKADSS